MCVCKKCGRDLTENEFAINRWGKRMGVCKECVAATRRQNQATKKAAAATDAEHQVLNARNLRIHDFTARELMEELARRGYRGKLEYVETKVIDITNF